MKWSSASHSGSRRPSISTTRPPSTTSDGSGSFGPFAATSPSSASGSIRSSRRSSRSARFSRRSDGKDPPALVDVRGLAYEDGGRRCIPVLQPAGPVLELRGGRAAGAKRGVDGEDRVVGERRELRGPDQVLRQ